jgi:hypothetical protein
MTGSTNWTETGLCTQSNNCIIVEDDGIANDYFAYWNRLKNDKQPARKPVTVRQGGQKSKGRRHHQIAASGNLVVFSRMLRQGRRRNNPVPFGFIKRPISSETGVGSARCIDHQ